MIPPEYGFRRALRFAGITNFLFFFVELWIALRIGSIGLFADSMDFLKYAAIGRLIFNEVRASHRVVDQVGKILSASMLLTIFAALWMACSKFNTPSPPLPLPLSVTGAAALVINLAGAAFLVRYRKSCGRLANAAFLSARNDAVANVAIVISGGLTAVTRSEWPDLVLGLGIATMNVGTSRAVWNASRN